MGITRAQLFLIGILVAVLVLAMGAPALAASAKDLPLQQTSPAAPVVAAAAAVRPVVTHSAEELTVVTLINDYREKHGLARLLISDLCTDAARKHSSDMAKYNFTGHISVKSDWFPVGSNNKDRMVACGYDYVTETGEICGYGEPYLAEEVFEAWCNSPVHNADMLGSDYKVVGPALVEGGSFGHYWTVDFGGYVDPTAHDPYPSAPTGLTVKSGAGQVRLAWSAVAGAAGYNVYRDGTKITATPVSATTYTDPGLTNGTTYSYQVSALVCSSETAKSTAVSATPAASGTASFLDVPATNPYYQAIEAMAGAGIIDGYPVSGGREFRPDDPVKRAQFAKMIDGALRLTVTEDLTSPFTDLGADVQDNLYPHEYVAAAFAQGIIKGMGTTTFAPWDPVKRSQVITMVVRALQNLHPGTLTIPPAGYTNTWGTSYDAEQGPLARIAEHNGLLAGLPLTTTARDPWGAMPRGEVAQVLWNVMQQLGS